LDLVLGLFVLTFAEVLIADDALGVDELERRLELSHSVAPERVTATVDAALGSSSRRPRQRRLSTFPGRPTSATTRPQPRRPFDAWAKGMSRQSPDAPALVPATDRSLVGWAPMRGTSDMPLALDKSDAPVGWTQVLVVRFIGRGSQRR
jgi:hypothetical protein